LIKIKKVESRRPMRGGVTNEGTLICLPSQHMEYI